MFCRQVFGNISGGFRSISCFFFLISRDFAEIPEFCGSATARNIRSLDLTMYEGNWCLIFRAFWSTFSVLSDNESTWYNLQNTDHVHCTLYIVSYFGEILQHSLSGFCWDTNNRKWTIVPFHFSYSWPQVNDLICRGQDHWSFCRSQWNSVKNCFNLIIDSKFPLFPFKSYIT